MTCSNAVLSALTPSDFKARFSRGFVYDANQNDYVSDDDITTAYSSACLTINESLFEDDALLKEAYLLLSAHKLACMLNEGGADSTPTFTEQSKSIGSVSASYAIPTWITESPTYAVYARTQYGIDYITLIRPLINKVGITGRRGSNF